VNKSLTIILACIIFLMVYKTLRRPEMYSDTSVQKILVPEETTTVSIDENKKYQKSGLDQQNANEIYIRIQEYMMQHKPFIEAELNLSSLAAKLELTNHHLSQVINQDQSANFYDFINSYRVDEVKRQLVNPENAKQSILSIAYEAGFNSKATFNRIFKERVQKTPSQYRKENS
jgi:AraC-like DNA-binding protein